MDKDRLFRWFSAVLIVILLVAVRIMEKEWFPEPLIDFFASDDYLTQALPAMGFADVFNTFLRYAVNSVLSVWLLYLLFHDKELTRWAVKFYTVAGIILFILYLILLWTYSAGHYRLLFYTRRLLVQPLFLFILLPGFYFIRSLQKNK